MEHEAYDTFLGGTCVIEIFTSDKLQMELRRLRPLGHVDSSGRREAAPRCTDGNEVR